MGKTFSLTLDQVDIINQSLERVAAISQLLADCGPRRKEVPESLGDDSAFVVMAILSEELEKIGDVLEAVGDAPNPGQLPEQ